MNNRSLVRISNAIGIISIVLLIYWVFVFITIQVFGLKIFRENITETFFLSIVGILSLMAGALIINIMFNLTRIAEKHNQDNMESKKGSKKIGLLVGLSFPIIFGLLFAGDYLTAKKKERMLVKSAKSIIERNIENTNKLVNYSFNEKWIINTDNIIELYSKTDAHFPNVSIIVTDSIDNSQVFLGFDSYNGSLNDTIYPVKKHFIKRTSKDERDYLNNVFLKNSDEVRFSAHDGDYELFYPYFKDGKKIVLYFSEYQRYGKIGS